MNIYNFLYYLLLILFTSIILKSMFKNIILQMLILYFKEKIEQEFNRVFDISWTFIYSKELLVYYSSNMSLDNKKITELQKVFVSFFLEICSSFYLKLFIYIYGNEETFLLHLIMLFNNKIMNEETTRRITQNKNKKRFK